ncbi:MAG: hypothetical protein HWD91_08730 [Marivivens sp.]|uniref:hypothetical protein n=1 Tax=Marivivens sp. TaxID=1978374 RepID=UPI0017C0AD2C|nr:hypothetical protein [Marivivens sp.]NVJ95658.1 hypothetical protein [Marivivens sp.]
MNIQDPRQQKAKRIFKAANLSVDWQDAWNAFYKAKSRSKARDVITKGEQLLKEQAELGLSLKPRDSVRHRILIAEDFLSKQLEAPTHKNQQTQMLQEYLTQLHKRSGE